MKRVIIAEKHDAALCIADALAPQTQQVHEQWRIVCGDDVVVWANGHLYEQAEPEYYDPKYHDWREADLPIIPKKIEILPIPRREAQIAAIQAELATADVVVHACDPDREGQLIGDEILAKAPQTPAVREAQRLWPDDLDESGLQHAFTLLKSDKYYRALMKSALGRSTRDWLFGYNLTRKCQLVARSAGYRGKVSIGRVKTPTLALIVERDLEIERFVSHPFWTLTATFSHANGIIVATWRPDASALGTDDHGRAIDPALAQRTYAAIAGAAGRIVRATENLLSIDAPLPMDLTELQVAAHKAGGLNAKETMAAAQSLYERHRAISYPRTSCRYLNDRDFTAAPDVMRAIATNVNQMAPEVKGADLSQKGRCFNDDRAGQSSAHKAIIPTARLINTSAWNANELLVYQLIARAYVAQFYPARHVLERSVTIECGRELFEATHGEEQQQGWSALYPTKRREQQPLPKVRDGDRVRCTNALTEEKRTEPPRHYDAATLARAMENIHEHMHADAETLKLMSEIGLGTVATRADIIETLISRDKTVLRDGHKLIATPEGRELIDALRMHPEITTPNMTAENEFQLDQVAKDELSFEEFNRGTEQQLRALIARLQIPRKARSS